MKFIMTQFADCNVLFFDEVLRIWIIVKNRYFVEVLFDLNQSCSINQDVHSIDDPVNHLSDALIVRYKPVDVLQIFEIDRLLFDFNIFLEL